MTDTETQNNADRCETFRRVGEILDRSSAAFAGTRAGRALINAPESPMPAPDPDPELVAILQRMRRKAEVMTLDAARPSTARQDAEEMRLLANMALRRIGVVV